MDALDFAISLAKGLNIEPPHVADVIGWDRLAGGAARLAKELGIPLIGCDYDRPCTDHASDFLMRITPGRFGLTLTFTCGCQIWHPAGKGAAAGPVLVQLHPQYGDAR